MVGLQGEATAKRYCRLPNLWMPSVDMCRANSLQRTGKTGLIFLTDRVIVFVINSATLITHFCLQGETAVMALGLPEGRDMLFGFYATGHSSLGEPSPRYVKELLAIAWGLPRVQGTSIWTMHVPKNESDCAPGIDHLFGGDKGCIIRDFYGSM